MQNIFSKYFLYNFSAFVGLPCVFSTQEFQLQHKHWILDILQSNIGYFVWSIVSKSELRNSDVKVKGMEVSFDLHCFSYLLLISCFSLAQFHYQDANCCIIVIKIFNTLIFFDNNFKNTLDLNKTVLGNLMPKRKCFLTYLMTRPCKFWYCYFWYPQFRLYS